MKRAVTIAAFAVLLTPALGAAHARLTRSSPAANDRLERSPESLTLWFSERPELRFTSIQLLDSSNTSIALGPVAKVAGDPSAVVVPVTASLAAGRYTVAWKTAASDGHPATGRFVFTVVVGSADRNQAAPTSDRATAPTPDRPNTIIAAPLVHEPLDTAEHWALLVAVVTAIGAIAFRGLVLTRARWDRALFDDAADRTRRLAQGALALAFIAAVTRLAAETRLMPDSPLRMGTMWEVARDTAWGRGWLVGAAGIVVAALALSFGWRRTAGWVIAALGALALALSQALTGHAGAAMSGYPLSVAADTVHLVAAGAWVGGLISVMLAGLTATGRAEEAERPSRGSSLVRAYHDIALPSVIVVALTGLANAWFRLAGLAALLTSAYGRVLIGKVFLFLVLAAFGYYHWRTMVAPNWAPSSAERFKRTALLELLVGALVLTMTALLVSLATPEHASHAP